MVEVTPGLLLITIKVSWAPGEYLLAGNSTAISGFDSDFTRRRSNVRF
jgi:hypothetical protein